MTELAIREAHGVVAQVAERDVIDGWITVMADVAKFADYISETDFVPKALRNRPAAIAAAILTGRELGIGPMQSLKSIHMVQNVPSLSAEYKRARALAAGHEIVFEETNSTRCIVRGRRNGSDRWVTITWTMDMARRAKLDGKEVWRAYPQRLLQARASSELCDLLFPDASLGLGTTEVIEDGGIVTESGETVDAATGELTSGPTESRPRTAQRKPRTQSPPPAQAAPPAAATATPSAGAGGDLPPLPGEEEPEPVPDESDYDTSGTAPVNMITAIWTSLSRNYDFGSDEKDQARMVCAHIAGHDLESTKALSRNEAKAILDTLAHWQRQAEEKGEHPREYMLALMVAQDTAGEADGE